MKKLFGIGGAALLLMLLLPTAASAMQVDAPIGLQVRGWYKDSFQIPVHYGNGHCTGPGITSTYIYHSAAAMDGAHTYYFMTDSPLFDDPYLAIDGPPPFPLVSPPPCMPTTSGSTTYNAVSQQTLKLDALPPSVSMTDPSSSFSTPGSAYAISGTVNDTASGVQYVQVFNNGAQVGIAAVSGNTFTASVSLATGANSIHVVAADNVDHTSTSNSATITRVNSAGTGSGSGTGTSGTTTTTNTGASSGSDTSGGSSPNSTGTTSSSNSSGTSGSQSTGSSVSNGLVKFNQGHIINLTDNLDSPSDPNVVLAQSGFGNTSSKVYYALIIILLILLLLCVFIFSRFRPIFAKLDRDNSGLRRRITLIVTLPSLIPLLGLGFLGYQQLSKSLKASVSQELSRASQTSSLKLEREFAIRHKVITSNASDIIQIKNQFQDQYDKLGQQKDGCLTVVNSSIPKGKYSQVVTNDNCLPFLAAFAQLSNPSSSTLASYVQAVNDGYTHTLSDMKADEQQRVNTLLGAVRGYFPDVTELAVISTASPAKTLALLPASGNIHPITSLHKNLLTHAQKDSSVILDNQTNPHMLLFSYPITDSGKNLIGNAIVAFNMEYAPFIPAIWQATPKPYTQDTVYFVNDQGEQVYPNTASMLTVAQTKKLTNTPSGQLIELTAGKQQQAIRVSSVVGTNWTVAVGAPPKTILAPIASTQRSALVAILCFLLLSLLLGIFFVSGVASEIERLLMGALAFAKGELDYKINLSSKDELRVLGDTMNQMAIDIKAGQDALVEKDKEFINVATHELKAPMTAIIGNLSMITDEGMGQVDDTARELIGQAYQGTVRLRDIVTDMLDIARLESGKAEFKLEPLDITALAKIVVDMQKIPAAQANLQLIYQPPAGLEEVLADKNKLQIIITNFVSNAIKYNRPGGSVTIAHEIKDDKLLTAVADTGLGIPDDQKSHIFEKFYRVQHDDRANVPGTGLGMHITKRFIESMGGSVWFDSVHGQGTIFYFTLPLAQPQTPAPAAAAETFTPAPAS